MLFGHYSLRKDRVSREVFGNFERENYGLQEKEKKEEEVIHPIQANITEIPMFFSDPGFFQNPSTDDDILVVINIAELSSTEFDPPSTEPNNFSYMEDSKIPEIGRPPQKKGQVW